LWRYVPLKTLFFYLSGKIFVPSLAKLQQADPFEGTFRFDTKDFEAGLKTVCADRFNEVQKWIRKELWTPGERTFNEKNPIFATGTDSARYFEFLSRTRYAWCWFQFDLESDAMWKIYGKEGVAIATTIEKLSAALKATNYDFEFGKMCYYHRHGRFSDAEKQQFVLRPQFLKRIEYIHEQEVRFTTCAPESENGGLLLNDVKPETWIKQIRLWPTLTSQEEDSIVNAVANKLPGVPCQKSDLLQPHGKAMSQMFEDLRTFAAVKSELHWKCCEDGVPSLLKNL